MTSSRAIVAVMILVIFTAALLTAREDVPRADVKKVGHQEMAVAPIAMPMSPERTARPPVEAAKTVAAATKPVATPSPQPTPASTTQPIAASPMAASPMATSMSHAIEPEREKPASVTISGCLENDKGTFVLTDAAGTATPTSRSWKSGFLRKRPAPIELADGVGTLSLRTHVGRRVAATGTLVDREMRVDTVRALGACE